MPGPLIAPLLEQLKNTTLHREATTFTGAPKKITELTITKVWAELAAVPDVRKKIRAIAKVPHPADADTKFKYRLAHVLIAIGVLSKRGQVELLLSDADGMRIGSPPSALICLEEDCHDPQLGDFEAGDGECCAQMDVTVKPGVELAKALAQFGAKHRQRLGLGPNAKTHIFVNPKSLRMLAISRA